MDVADDEAFGEAREYDTSKLRSTLQDELDELASGLERIVKPEDFRRAIRTVRHTKSLIALH